MKYLILNLILALVLIPSPSAVFAREYNLELTVNGVKEIKGDMSVALYDSGTHFPSNTNYVFAQKIPIVDSVFKFTFTKIPAGNYAIAIYQDLDRNGELNKNWMGVPKEPYGFSNDVRKRMGPPDFEDAAFSLTSDSEITIQLID